MGKRGSSLSFTLLVRKRVRGWQDFTLICMIIKGRCFIGIGRQRRMKRLIIVDRVILATELLKGI